MKHILSVLFAAVGLICTTGVAFAEPLQPLADAADNVTAIQAAIDAEAILPDPGTVTLGEGLFEIDSQLMVTGGVKLVGQGWDKTILKRVVETPDGDSRVVWVDGGATVSHVAITGGSLNLPGGWSWGAGAFVVNGTISWCCITNNTSGVNGTSNNYGGGVGFGDGTGQIDHSIVADNVVRGLQTSFGGGIAIRHPKGNVTIDTCLISGNRVFISQIGAGDAFGGGAGIDIELWSHSKNYNMTVRNSTIVGNSSEGAASLSLGGAILTRADEGSKFSMLNCIIAGNTTAGTNTTVALDYDGGVDYCLFDIEADKVGANSLYGDPVFVDVDDDDYRLDLTSPAVGKGETYAGIDKDLNDAAFSNPPSMGCYEYAELAARPAFEIASGTTFYPATNVTLTCATKGATIYYTTDGSRPTNLSTEYTGPIAISATTTIKARAYAPNVGPSGIATATYTLKRPTTPLTDFKKYVEVTLSTDLASSEITTGIPALVKLSESTIAGFDYDDFSLANGGDMMFVDENGVAVPHEIETWNTDGESLVWVKLPSTAENTKVFMYYGNGATSSEEAENVWTDYVGIWHLNEASGDAQDSTGHGLTAVPTGANSAADSTGAVCRVGFGRQMASAMGNKSYLSVADNALLDCGDTLTFSGWFKAIATYPNYGMRYVSRKTVYTAEDGWEAEARYSDNVDYSATEVSARGAGSGDHWVTVPDVRTNWLHLALVYHGTKVTFYANGQLVKDYEMSGKTATDNDNPLAFGNNSAGNEANWVGFMDELRLSADSRSADYVLAEYNAMNTSTNTDIFTYGAAQDVGIMPVVGDPSATWKAIQDAIDAAAPTHGTVTLASGLFEINAQLNVTSGVTLVGQGWENTVIKQTTVPGWGANARCAMLDDGAKLNGITLTGGTIKNENDGGAGVWVKNGTISWCCITNNVGGQNNVYGCGVSFSGGQGTIDHSIISDNRAADGGNYYGGGIGGLDTVGPVLIDTCLVANNTLGENSAGGGIGIKGTNVVCEIRNCTVVGNTGSLYAGGIRLEKFGTGSVNGKIKLINVLAYGNTMSGLAANSSPNFLVDPNTFNMSGSGNCFFGIESETNSIPGSLYGDPLFVDAAHGDYRLQSTSPAVEKGATYDGIAKDLEDKYFVWATPTIGCYEFNPNATPRPDDEWDIPGGGSGGGSGGIKALDDGNGIKYIVFTSIVRDGTTLTVGFQADKVDANGQTFGLICKDNLADTTPFTLNATLTNGASDALGTLTTTTDKTQIFAVGIGPAQ